MKKDRKMKKNTGWIKLHRSLKSWGWRNHPNTLCVFINLLLEANHQKRVWNGVEVSQGQLIFGRKKFSEKTGISEQSVRTALKHLKSTNEITIKTTNKYSLISINNWSKYQATNQQTNKRSTSNQPHLKNVYKNVYKNKVNFDEFGNSFSVRESDKQIKPLKELLK